MYTQYKGQPNASGILQSMSLDEVIFNNRLLSGKISSAIKARVALTGAAPLNRAMNIIR